MTECDPHAARPRQGRTKALEPELHGRGPDLERRSAPPRGSRWTILHRERTPRYFPPTRGALSVSGVLDMAPADAAGGEGEWGAFRLQAARGEGRLRSPPDADHLRHYAPSGRSKSAEWVSPFSPTNGLNDVRAALTCSTSRMIAEV
jgi:hypothetical protein